MNVLVGLSDDIKKTWVKILLIYILDLAPFFIDYSFFYSNEKLVSVLEWIDPSYIIQFITIGLIGCVVLCRQRLKEFSTNILNLESLIVLLVNVIFILFVAIVGKTIGQYDINWIAVLNRSLYCYIYVGITEEWVYRGFIVTQMQKVIKNNLAIVVISAVLFSLMHLPFYLMYNEITFGGVLYRLVIPLLMGLIYAHIYLCKGNLFVVVLLHGSYNLIENIAFDSWQYIAYGICWVLMLGYAFWCYKRKNTESQVA